ncbi:energy transducer TonB [Hyphomicrobium sp. LHD-15]|uniref:energy transducer TonB family protein n=1 Tax=Hyphomicrobium sp. LHD-15 TaxID=3072142 RepID=UPI00280E2693|nr:energy transducer TonB [Hyphomicrobium sp. LHD-15]MDQ8697782.1 energy transducer TonB [Hyphomicrobium sp. LHD-15]
MTDRLIADYFCNNWGLFLGGLMRGVIAAFAFAFVLLAHGVFLGPGTAVAQTKSKKLPAAQTATKTEYARYIYARIASRTAFAPTQGRTGTVHVAFRVMRSGQLSSIKVAKSSGNPFLDAMAFLVIDRAQPFAPAPPSVAGDTFVIPIVFRKTPALFE